MTPKSIEMEEKMVIISEYLAGDTSYRILGAKYGVPFRTIQHWVMRHLRANKKQKIIRPIEEMKEQAPLPTDIKELQAELRKSRLLNEVLNQVINIAEEELGVPIRKKYGTKRF